MIFLYAFPTYYLSISRLKSKLEKISWTILYIIPVFLVIYASLNVSVQVLIPLYFISVLSFYSVYEMGYLENDLITTQKETLPTIRLQPKEQIYLTKNYNFIVLIKVALTFALLLTIKYLAELEGVKVYLLSFIVGLVLVRVCFFVHNTIRNRMNVVSFCALAILKYLTPALLFISVEEISSIFWVSFFMFPFLRTLEHATKPKYGFNRLTKLLGNHDLFRIKYYSVALISIILISYLPGNIVPKNVILIFLYYFSYRAASYIFLYFKGQEVKSFRDRRHVQKNTD